MLGSDSPVQRLHKTRILVLAEVLALAEIYFCCATFGLSLARINASASAIWPPTGVALAALLLRGARLWPGVLLGAFAVNFMTQGNVATALSIATGNTLEAATGAWLVNRFAGGMRALERTAYLFRFVLWAAMVSTLLSPAFGVISLCLAGLAAWHQFWPIWLTWWLGDMASNLVVAPLLLVWLVRPRALPKPARVLEGVALTLLVGLIGEIVFLDRTPFGSGNRPLEYLAIPPLLWAAFRFGGRGAITASFGMSAIALWGTLHGRGPFVRPDANESLLLLQAFMGTTTMTTLVLTLVITERRRTEQRLAVQDAVSRVLAEAPSLTAAAPRILRALGTKGGWQLSVFWEVNPEARQLSCLEIWHDTSSAFEEFETLTRQVQFSRGAGLPVMVWASSQAAWIDDLSKETNFPRAMAAAKTGLRGAFCFPLKVGQEVLGVIECFSRHTRQPDEDFLQMLAALGSQVGQFIEQNRAEQEKARLAAIVESSREMLRRYAGDLEKRVEERTAALQETIRSLDAFCYSIAHDLRAPLRAMIGFSAELLEQYEPLLDDTGRDYLRRIQAGGRRMDQLILDLLKLGRLNTAELAVETVDVEEALRKALALLENEIQAKGAQVALKQPLLSVRGTGVVVEQILLNLLGNALKFAPAQDVPRVEIWTEPHNGMVRVSVKDNGIGIKEEHVRRLFQPFVRLVNPEDYPGTGIGLAIVRKGVERMGGRVGVQSQPGKGSCFWIELPAAGVN